MRKLLLMVLAGLLLSACSSAFAAEQDAMLADMQALKQRVAELEKQQTDEYVQARNSELMRQMLQEFATESHSYAADTGLVAGYKNGFFIKSTDDQFQLNIKSLFQFRHGYLYSDDGDRKLNINGTRAAGGNGADCSANAFEIERARLKLDGHIMKDLLYTLQFEFDDDGDNAGRLIDYYVKYSFMPELGVRVGRGKEAFGKQENTSSGKFMLVDRSLANEVFNLGRGTGIEAYGMLPCMDNSLYYRVGIYNDFQDEDATNPWTDNDNAPALATRIEMPLMGACPADFANESDITWHDNPVALVGISAAYDNSRTEDHFAVGDSDNYEVLARGADGRTDIYELGGECTMFGADVSMKCQGLSVTLEGFYQHNELDSKEVTAENDFGTRAAIDGLGTDNYGWYAQSGYFLVPQVFEVVARAGSVCVDSSNDSYEYTGGWNWYLGGAGQALKLSMDVTYIDDLPITSTGPNYAGIQNNSLFMIRSQLQVAF